MPPPALYVGATVTVRMVGARSPVSRSPRTPLLRSIDVAVWSIVLGVPPDARATTTRYPVDPATAVQETRATETRRIDWFAHVIVAGAGAAYPATDVPACVFDTDQ
jgi:hypothetical protein